MPTIWIVDDSDTEREAVEQVLEEVARETSTEFSVVEWDGSDLIWLSTIALSGEGLTWSTKKEHQVSIQVASPGDAELTINSAKAKLERAEIVILDIDLGRNDAYHGLDVAPLIPGVRHDLKLGPFILVWTNFDARYKVADFLRTYESDRIWRTQVKSQEVLKEYLRRAVDRLKGEGIYHGEQRPRPLINKDRRYS